MAALFRDKTLQRNTGPQPEQVDAASALSGKLVALYFSAHWCPPCKAFTPFLKEFYEEANKSGGGFEVVFLSLDRNIAECNEYLAESHGPWLFLHPDDPKVEELAGKFEVDGIPSLLVVNADGSKVHDGRSDVKGVPPRVALSQWAEQLKA